jgi:lysophospholipase L1-like esterase
MMHSRYRSAVSVIALVACVAQVQAQTEGLPWIGTWSAAPASELSSQNASLPTFVNQTLRQYVFTSVGGQAARLHFSNQYGTTPLILSDVHIGQSDPVGNVVPGTESLVTFQGQSTVSIPAGQSVVSDGAATPVPANSYMAVSAYFPGPLAVTNYTTHVFTEQYMQLVDGDQSSTASLSAPSYPSQYFFLTSMDVQNPVALGSLVTLGASITDGFNSTVGANHRWSNYLSARLVQDGLSVGVLNQGIAGGTLTHDNQPLYGEGSLNRFDRDVLKQPGARWVVHTEFNDLGPDNLDQLIAAEQQMMNQAHAHHIKYLCSTFPPVNASGAYEGTRQGLNTFLRAPGNGCDGLVDQDAVLRDPSKPSILAPQYFGTSDGVHPNDAGYQAIAGAVDLLVFREPTPPPANNPQTDCSNGWGAGQTFAGGSEVRSCSGRYLLGLQGDGNFVLYDGATPIWASMVTLGKQVAAAEMLSNGNFVIYDTTGKPVWATNTEGHDGSRLLLQDDGNLVIYDGSNVPVWNTGTQRQ